LSTAFLVTKPWLGSVEPDDLEFGQAMLGKFLGQLAEAPEKPTAICFYTEGVRAAIDGSPCAEVLERLEAAGIPLLLCGSCIDYYQIADRVIAGQVSDMATIAGALGGAGKVITV
jgi:hypothetical protein